MKCFRKEDLRRPCLERAHYLRPPVRFLQKPRVSTSPRESPATAEAQDHIGHHEATHLLCFPGGRRECDRMRTDWSRALCKRSRQAGGSERLSFPWSTPKSMKIGFFYMILTVFKYRSPPWVLHDI